MDAKQNFSQLYAIIHQSADDLSAMAERGKVTLAEADDLVRETRAALTLAAALRRKVVGEPEPIIG